MRAEVTVGTRDDVLAVEQKKMFDLSKIQDPELENTFKKDIKNRLEVGSDDLYFETITAEEKEIIKQYFKE